jgi:hypothetical protein
VLPAPALPPAKGEADAFLVAAAPPTPPFVLRGRLVPGSHLKYFLFAAS